jgi:hypothetical protein
VRGRCRCVKSQRGNRSVGAVLCSEATHHHAGLMPRGLLHRPPFVSPAVVAPHIRGLCIFTWSSDRALTRAVGGPNSFWGSLALRSLKRACSRARLPGATVGVLDTRVSRSTYSWAPSTAQLRPRGGTMTEASGEDPHEEAPHEENDD